MGFHPMTAAIFALFGSFPGIMLMSVALTATGTKLDKDGMVQTLQFTALYCIVLGVFFALVWYGMKVKVTRCR